MTIGKYDEGVQKAVAAQQEALQSLDVDAVDTAAAKQINDIINVVRKGLKAQLKDSALTGGQKKKLKSRIKKLKKLKVGKRRFQSKANYHAKIAGRVAKLKVSMLETARLERGRGGDSAAVPLKKDGTIPNAARNIERHYNDLNRFENDAESDIGKFRATHNRTLEALEGKVDDKQSAAEGTSGKIGGPISKIRHGGVRRYDSDTRAPVRHQNDGSIKFNISTDVSKTRQAYRELETTSRVLAAEQLACGAEAKVNEQLETLEREAEKYTDVVDAAKAKIEALTNKYEKNLDPKKAKKQTKKYEKAVKKVIDGAYKELKAGGYVGDLFKSGSVKESELYKAPGTSGENPFYGEEDV